MLHYCLLQPGTSSVPDFEPGVWFPWMQVQVLHSDLIAAIAGGDRTVGSSSSFTLDASSSYDPDSTRLVSCPRVSLCSSRGDSDFLYTPLIPGSTSLSYNWTCIKGGTSYGQSCGLTYVTTTSTTTVPKGTSVG